MRRSVLVYPLLLLIMMVVVFVLAPTVAQATSPPTPVSGISMVATTTTQQAMPAAPDINFAATSSPPTAISRGGPTTGSFSSIQLETAKANDAVMTSSEQARAPDGNAMVATSMDQMAGIEADTQYQKMAQAATATTATPLLA